MARSPPRLPRASAGVLSFGRGKGWTGGGGGALLARGNAASWVTHLHVGKTPILRSAATLGQAAAQWALGAPPLYAAVARLPFLHLGETRYHDPPIPHTMPGISAALLKRTCAMADREAKVRRENGAAWLAELQAAPAVQTINVPAAGGAGWLRMPVRVSQGINGFSNRRRAIGIGVAPGYPKSLGELTPVRMRMTRLTYGQSWSGAETLTHQLITLPTHALMAPCERMEILRLLDDYAA